MVPAVRLLLTYCSRQ